MQPLIPKGTKIACPKCLKLLAESNRDIFSGDCRNSADFNEILPGSVTHSGFMECPECKVLYYEQISDGPPSKKGLPRGPGHNRLHTDKGWIKG